MVITFILKLSEGSSTQSEKTANELKSWN